MRLLDRQLRLLEYLTSGGAIFRDQPETPLDPALQGMARGRLDLEARFSYEKRMEKIAGVFPRTMAHMGPHRDALLRAFVEACPPHDINRLANARQFHDFLVDARDRLPAYLPDLAACELACGAVRSLGDDPDAAATSRRSQAPEARRRRDMVLLCCAFDVRGMFEEHGILPPRRDTRLAIVADPHGGDPDILELAPEIFDLIGALDDWTDMSAFENTPDGAELVAELAQAGLLETRR
ncbi:MAG: hypothetical protein IT537_26640 [Hyphomicrobiales bacterium]|nr:hypothetical protein [Hyphomicrobiales bacterium]